MSFYGTNVITHIPRSSFDISHTYPNAVKMHQSINEDKVPIYGYVIVDYNHPNPSFNEDGQEGLYQFNNQFDQLAYGSDTLIINYDQTVWQKLLDYDDKMVYRAIARLNSILPNFSKPADFFKKDQSLVTFQRLNAIPSVHRDVPRTYQAFGTIILNEAKISFDNAAITKFNEKYPAPPEGVNKIPMEMHEEHGISKDDSAQFEAKIREQITTAEEGIQAAETALKNARNSINTNTTNITTQLAVIKDEETAISTSTGKIMTALTALNTLNTNFKSANNTINTQSGNISEYITTISSAVSGSNNLITNTITKAISDITSEISNINNQCTLLTQESESISSGISNYNTKLNAANSTISTAKTNLNTQKTALTNIYEALLSSASSIDTNLSDLNELVELSTIEGMDVLLTNITADNDIINENIETLNSTLTSINNIINTLTTQSASSVSLKATNDCIASIKKSATNITTHNKTISDNIAAIQENNETIAAQVTNITTANEEIIEAKNNLISYQESYVTHRTTIATENDKINTSQGEIVKARGLISGYNENIKSQNTIIGEQITILSEKYTDLTYYKGMLDWYLEIFLPELKLNANIIPEKLYKFNSNTLEYPTK